jgi:hypothetical protein
MTEPIKFDLEVRPGYLGEYVITHYLKGDVFLLQQPGADKSKGIPLTREQLVGVRDTINRALGDGEAE